MKKNDGHVFQKADGPAWSVIIHKRWFVCTILIALLSFIIIPASASFDKTADQAVAWVLGHEAGKGYEYDGFTGYYDDDGNWVYVGPQCVDFIVGYMKYISGTNTSGNGADYSWNWLPDGYTRIEKGIPNKGDILVWTYNTYGHVAIVTNVESSGRVIYSEQNVGGNNKVRHGVEMWPSSNSYWGIIRPDFKAVTGTLDVNGRLDGVDSGSLGAYGTFDISVGGTNQDDVNDYYANHENNTSYSITDIKAKPGYEFIEVVSGNTSGTITAGSSINVRISFATQGHLFVQGNLDGIADSSTEGYGTFDVYINDVLESSNCTSYNKQWPRNTKYEVKNIRTADGKSYDGLTCFTGTIKSNAEAKVVLPYSTNGTATPEWQTGKVVPGNLDLDILDVEYSHHYEKVATSSPGEGWVQAGVNRTYYQNSGSVQEFPYERATSDTYVYVGGYYYHWCGTNGRVNYDRTDTYNTYHGPNGLDAFDVVSSGPDDWDANITWYLLNWKPGQPYSGRATCASDRSAVWYRMYQYQPRALITEYNWTKDTDWTNVYDASATSYNVRWRLKDGVASDYKGLQLYFMVDGVSVSSLDGVAGLNVYFNGTLKAENVTTFKGYYPGDFAYEIELVNIAEDKLYKQIIGGDLTGTVEEDMKTITLCFVTGVEGGKDWKTISEGLLPYLDDNVEIEYRHTYTQKTRTSPGEGWIMTQEGAVQYENDGAQYESDNELATSATRVLVGYYYFHWCNNGSWANYYEKPEYPVKHVISMENATHFSVAEAGEDGDGSGRKYYFLTHLDTEYAGYIAKCGATGSQVYYRGGVYQNKKAYRINTYQMTGDWVKELDTTATSVEYRIRLKRYNVVFIVEDGEFDIENLIKYSGEELILPTEIPTRELYEFISWNTEIDGTGTAYLPGAVYSNDEDTVLFARWKELATLNLPSDLSTIEEEAFSNVDALIIRVPASCTTIKSKAFANNQKLKRIYIPITATTVALDAFDGCPNLTIYAPAGSTAIKVAKYNDIPYVEE